MKIFAISDLHLSINNPKPMDIFGPVWDNYLQDIEADWNSKVGADDIVLIPGDISWAMHFEESKVDLDYIGGFIGKKVLLRGNHDYWWKSISLIREYLPNGTYAIQNDAIRFDGVVICGTRGWTVPENEHKTEQDKKIYDREVLRLKLSLDNAKAKIQPGDKLVCMMHYPPYNSKYEESDFTKLLEEYGVNVCVFGHIHSYNKAQKLTHEMGGVKYYLTSCDLVKNKLVYICG